MVSGVEYPIWTADGDNAQFRCGLSGSYLAEVPM